MTLHVREYHGVRITTDDQNPRIYHTEYRCFDCGNWVDQDDVVWVDPVTSKATTGDDGVPFHVDCAPEENYDDTKFIADVIQFIRPNGKKKYRTVDLPVEVKSYYDDMIEAGCCFEAEVLTTNGVAVSISNDEEDIDICIVEKGPAVLQSMINMLKRQLWKKDKNE